MTRSEAIDILRVSQNPSDDEIVRAADERESEQGEASSPEQARTLEDRRRRILAAKSLLLHVLSVIHIKPELRVQQRAPQIVIGEPVPVVRRKISPWMIIATLVAVWLAGWAISQRSQLSNAASALEQAQNALARAEEQHRAERDDLRRQLSGAKAAEHDFAYLLHDTREISVDSCMLRTFEIVRSIVGVQVRRNRGAATMVRESLPLALQSTILGAPAALPRTQEA